MNYHFEKGLRISEIGIGCYSLSGVYGAKNRDDFRRMLLRAVELGVNYFDTAGSYGEKAEELLGKTLAPLRKKIIISTKVGIADEGRFDLSRKNIIRSCQRSLSRLGTDYIDVFHVHFDDPKTPVEETLEALEGLKKEGEILQYGVGHLPPERVQEYLEKGKPFSLMMELSAASRDGRKRFFPLLEKYHVPAIAFSITGRGMLAFKSLPESFPPGDLRNYDPLFQRGLRASGLRVRQKLEALARSYGKTLAQVAIAWVLSQSCVLCALCGPSSVQHLEENVGASGFKMPPGDLQELEVFFKEEDEILKRESHKTLKIILFSPLSPSNPVGDLIYSFEAMVNMGILKEKEALPFLQIWRKDEKKSLGDLEEVKEKLRAIYEERVKRDGDA